MTIYKTEWLNCVKLVNITLPKTPSSIGIMLSGGADSSLLLYLLCEENKIAGNIHTIIPFTVPKTDGAAFHAGRVLGFFKDEYGIKLPPLKIVGDPNEFHDKQVSSGISEALKSRFCDLLFIGENQNPPEIFPMKGLYPNRLKINPYDNIVHFPFLHLYKTHIINLYTKLRILELASITHTCTASQSGRCLECFACDERRWAYEELDIIDLPVINQKDN